MRCNVNLKTTNIMSATLLVIGMFLNAAQAIEKPDSQPISGKIKWVYDYQEGKRASQETGKPTFVVFRCER